MSSEILQPDEVQTDVPQDESPLTEFAPDADVDADVDLGELHRERFNADAGAAAAARKKNAMGRRQDKYDKCYATVKSMSPAQAFAFFKSIQCSLKPSKMYE